MKALVVSFLAVSLLFSVPTIFDNSPRQFVLPVGTTHSFVGSAVLIAPGKLVTAAHVASIAKVVLYKGVFVPITVVYMDKVNDIAVMQAVGVECPCTLIQTKTPDVDDQVVKVGFGLFPEVGVQNSTEGKFQGEALNDRGGSFYMVGASAAPGDSGGGMFVKHLGQYYLIGVTSAIAVYGGEFFPTLFPFFVFVAPLATLPSAQL